MLSKLINIKCIITFIGSYVIIIFSGCGKLCLDGAKTTFNFQIAVKAYPDRDSIRVGDTIWFEIDAPTSLADLNSNKIIDYSGAGNLGSAIIFEKIMSPSNFQSSTNKFRFLLVKGREVENSKTDLIKEYLFEEQNSKYTFKLGLIPKEAGVFGVVFGNAANVFRTNDKCTKASFEINFENTDQHRYLYPNFTGGNPKGGDYYFKVY